MGRDPELMESLHRQIGEHQKKGYAHKIAMTEMEMAAVDSKRGAYSEGKLDNERGYKRRL